MDDLTELESLPIEQLIEMIREKTGAGGQPLIPR
jgi:adenine-specific DNA-methyltransferase